MKERRKYIRYDLEGWANLKFEVEGTVDIKPVDASSHGIKSELRDISFGGMSVLANEKIEVGVDVLFDLVTKFWDESIAGRGKIKYVREIKRYETAAFRIGIEFIDINKESIQDILNQILKEICEAARKKEQFRKF